MLQVAVGHSEDVDSLDAIEEALDQCARRLDGTEPAAALLLASVSYEHQVLLDRIEARHPGLPLIGGTTDGEMSSELGFREDSVHLVLLGGDGLTMRTGVGRDASLDIEAAARQAVDDASVPGVPPALCFTVPDGVTLDITAVIEGLKASLGERRFPIFGGAAGDHRTFDQTRQFYDGLILTDSVPVLLVSGDLQCSFGVGSGWQPVGHPLTVTRAEGNKVYTLDDQPALDVYRAHLGDTTSPGSFADFPLAVFEDPEQPHEFTLRAPFFVDEEERSLTFAGHVRQGCRAQISQGVRGGVLEGAQSAMDNAARAYPGDRPDAAFVVSCAARKWLLGGRAAEEAGTLRTTLDARFPGDPIPLCGFYSFGEISPLRPDGETRFHNETLVTLLVGSR